MPPRRSARTASTTANNSSQDTQPVDTKKADADTQIEEDSKPVVRRSSRKVTAKPTADNTTPAPAATKTKSRKPRKGTTATQDTGSQDTTAADQAAKGPKAGKKRALSSGQSEDEAAEKPKSKKAKKSAPAKAEDEASSSKDDAKMVTILKRGAAPVDPASSYVSSHQVYVSSAGEVWDAMLNQTNIGKNANKFYVLQLLHPIGNASNCLLYLRWGRTGENGASQTKGPWPAAQAINEFKKQFRSKTSTPWELRKDMVAKPGKYTWLERDFESPEEDDTKDNGKGKAPESRRDGEKPREIAQCTLSTEVQSLCRIIFNSGILDAALSSMNYDANKLPLGKLSKATILRGFAALKALSEVIENPTEAAKHGGLLNACSELSGQYYSIIPHVFGRNKPTIINNMLQLKKELELVDALGDMEIAQKLISEKIETDADGNLVNPIDAQFKSLQLESMDAISTDSKEFANLAAYARDTHGATHSHYKVTLETAFRVKRRMENENWMNAGFDNVEGGKRMLLWHGSRAANFAGILSQGLRIAPPEAPVNGYMFGKGVYFADMMSKSYNYCYAHSSENMGILLLCDVIAQPYLEMKDAAYDAAEKVKEAGKLATKGLGRTAPVEWQDAGEALDNEDLKGCIMPKGAAQDISIPGAYLQYNEYIVYNTAQIRVKYLLMVRMG